jgi:hypothetical protein
MNVRVNTAFEEARKENRYVRVPVAPEIISRTIRDGSPRITIKSGLPPDAIFAGADFDHLSRCFVMFFLHPSFDPVPLGQMLPNAEIVMSMEPE